MARSRGRCDRGSRRARSAGGIRDRRDRRGRRHGVSWLARVARTVIAP
jgi:hypothetical protein